jgi:hypothetical protein
LVLYELFAQGENGVEFDLHGGVKVWDGAFALLAVKRVAILLRILLLGTSSNAPVV